MKNQFGIKLILCFVLSFLLGSLRVEARDDSPSSVCVLIFEDGGSPFANAANLVFGSYERAFVKTVATPLDFISCVSQGYEEIVMVLHSAPGLNSAKKGWFVFLNPEGEGFQMILNRPFEIARKWLAQNRLSKLKKIRIASCDAPEVLKERYPSFLKLVAENQVQLTYANSFIQKGKPVMNISLKWLAESIDPANLKAWRTDKNIYCEKDFWSGCDRSAADFVFPANPW